MDKLTQERYGPLTAEDLAEERWPWRGKPATNTAAEVARRRRQLWLAFTNVSKPTLGVAENEVPDEAA